MPASSPRPPRLTRSLARDDSGDGWFPGDPVDDGYDGYDEPLPPRGGPRARTWALSLLGAAVVGVGIGFISLAINRTPTLPPLASTQPSPSTGSSSSATGAPGAALTTQVVSYDPLPTGSGLARSGGGGATVWTTQQYRGANFSGLKAGVGLLADFGSPTRVSTATFTTTTPGFTVQLLAGDTAPVQGGASLTQPLPAASAPQPAGTSSTLTATSATPHRYWMVWITNLTGSGATYSASLTTPTFTG